MEPPTEPNQNPELLNLENGMTHENFISDLVARLELRVAFLSSQKPNLPSRDLGRERATLESIKTPNDSDASSIAFFLFD